eukprot:6888557-Pyramimonas_sp.AAC.1
MQGIQRFSGERSVSHLARLPITDDYICTRVHMSSRPIRNSFGQLLRARFCQSSQWMPHPERPPWSVGLSLISRAFTTSTVVHPPGWRTCRGGGGERKLTGRRRWLRPAAAAAAANQIR